MSQVKVRAIAMAIAMVVMVATWIVTSCYESLTQPETPYLNPMTTKGDIIFGDSLYPPISPRKAFHRRLNQI